MNKSEAQGMVKSTVFIQGRWYDALSYEIHTDYRDENKTTLQVEVNAETFAQIMADNTDLMTTLYAPEAMQGATSRQMSFSLSGEVRISYNQPLPPSIVCATCGTLHYYNGIADYDQQKEWRKAHNLDRYSSEQVCKTCYMAWQEEVASHYANNANES